LMDVTSAVNYTPLMILTIFASMIISASVLMRLSGANQSLGDPTPGKFKSLEGLRGLLASSVYAGHCVISFGYMQSGNWESPKYALYSWATKGAVAAFFMITGLLFWTTVLNVGCDYRSHFKSRLKRIYPLYLFMALIVLIIIMIESKFKTKVPPLQMTKELILWFLPGFVGIGSINDTAILFINAGVIWTLQYEWGFYFLLPVISLFFRKNTWLMVGIYISIFLVAYIFKATTVVTHMKVALPLLLGCISAYLIRNKFWETNRQTTKYQWIAMLLLGSSVVLYVPGYSTVNNVLLLWPAFTLIAGGVNVFGLLSTRPMIYLGRISFGVYLLHGIFLYFLRSIFIDLNLAPHERDVFFVYAVVPLSLLVTWICSVVHIRIELPFMKRKIPFELRAV
jgi:peptidoglycan/LPS O-acetylase OafA/YrhL